MQPRRPRKALLAVTAFAAVALALSMVSSSFATLTGSTFNTSNGDLTTISTTIHDWNPHDQPTGNLGPVEPISCADGTNCGLDPTNSSSDNALGQGTKEDDTNVTVVDGSIPKNKDDLSRFYVNKERGSNGHDFLYLAWERTNLLGSAHMDFEFNQEWVGIDPTTVGAQTLNRTAGTVDSTGTITGGDILIDFDFGGSGVPALAMHRWINTNNPSRDCEAVSSGTNVFCWSKGVNLTDIGAAEASVNEMPVTDYNSPDAPRTLDGSTSKNGTISSTFGEAAIDLQAAGVFPLNQCAHFGDAWLKSRSSGNSFGSELKDFVAPIHVNISNCGTIEIVKDAVPNDPQDFSYTSDITGHTSFKLDDDGNNSDTLSNTATFNDVLAGSYYVTEGSVTNWALTDLKCTVTGTGGSSGAQDTTDPYKANIVLKVGDKVSCKYTNTLQLGAIKITKKSSKDNTVVLSGAKFSITSGGNAISGSPFTTDSNGVVCVDQLPYGNYVVTETDPPTNYKIDDTTGHTVTVNTTSSCPSTNIPSTQMLTFTDTPLSQIEVKFTSLAGTGVTKASIVCQNGTTTVNAVSENGAADPALDDTDETFTSLTPGTYTCTVVVDP